MTTTIAMDFFLENLMELIDCNSNNLIVLEKALIYRFYKELGFLTKFIDEAEYIDDEEGKVKDLVSQIKDLAYKAENIIESFVSDASIFEQTRMPEKTGQVIPPPLNLSGVMEEIKSLKPVVMGIYEKKIPDTRALQIGKSLLPSLSRANNTRVEEETVVGFDDSAIAIKEKLTRSQRRLDVVSIVGMAGVGKTTLARKVYNDPLVVYHFDIRAWTYVSQVYTKKDLLLSILDSAFNLEDEVYKLMEENLGEVVYKRLKGRRYLIVIDDIWSIGAWNDLKKYFPDDCNGSRIMLTSRLTDVALHAKPNSIHSVGFLTQRDSWDLLEQKVFEKKNCPAELQMIGKSIVEKCGGLPLAIVDVAGILKKDMTREWWMLVAEHLSSHIFSDTEQCLNILELSYNHLPHYLKACFLYFGAFPEDNIINVRQLIMLWIAEGFIRKNAQKSLEEIAEDYLVDLIDQSLVMVSDKRSNGGIKACQVHDLFRDFCLRKAEEENFLQRINGHYVSSPRRLVHSHTKIYYTEIYAPHLRSFLSIGPPPSKPIFFPNASFVRAFKLLRVLNLRSVTLSHFPNEVDQLVHLRYLALCVSRSYSKPNIFNLYNLETFDLNGSNWLEMPDDIWKMWKLRHLNIHKSFKLPCFPYDLCTFELQNLQSIGYLDLFGGTGNEQLLSSIPNLRKLKCNRFPKVNFLIHLETLKVCYEYETPDILRFPTVDKFPPSLKKLTLSRSRLPWTEISILGALPNLEILKLLDDSFEGQTWDTRDWQFRKLKFLKFKGLDIVEWNASRDHFPNLQRLVMDSCFKFKEIPFELGNILTLELIELWWPSESAANSAMQIQKEQWSMDNHELEILIHQIKQDSEEDSLSNTGETPQGSMSEEGIEDTDSLPKAGVLRLLPL